MSLDRSREFEDPKMEVLYQIRPYLGSIFAYIGLTQVLYYSRYLQLRFLKWPIDSTQLWKNTIVNGKNLYFNGHVQWRCKKITEESKSINMSRMVYSPVSSNVPPWEIHSFHGGFQLGKSPVNRVISSTPCLITGRQLQMIFSSEFPICWFQRQL